MKHAIRKHLWEFLAVVAVVAIGAGVGAYILSEQRLRFPLVEEEPFRVKVELADAQAVIPGQGQTVRVAGVRIGDVGDVELEDGHAVVTLDIERRFEGLIRTGASALLRSKTPLKDMFVEVDPGSGRPLRAGERIPISRTAPDIDLDEVLSALDADTRDYLRLLVSGGGKGLEGRGDDLAETLRRLAPLHRDLARVSGAAARRRGNLRRLVNRYSLLAEELGRSDREIVRLVRAGSRVFDAIASEQANLSRAVAALPATLRETDTALASVEVLGRRLPPAVEALRPAVRELEPAARALEPLAQEGTPILRDRLRPFAREAGPPVERLGGAAGDLQAAAPDLATSLGRVNRLLNILAFNPDGAEGLSGDLARDRARQESYLYWLAWTAQSGISLFGTADGQGVFRRITLGGVNCGLLVGAGVPQPVADLFGTAGLCSAVEG